MEFGPKLSLSAELGVEFKFGPELSVEFGVEFGPELSAAFGVGLHRAPVDQACTPDEPGRFWRPKGWVRCPGLGAVFL